jgi:hypothetical protein
MITLASFDAPEDAYLFRSFMGSRGIGVSVLDEHIAQLFWHYRYAAGGVRVVLDDQEDAEMADAATAEYFAAIRSAPPAAPEMRGWPLVLLLSFWLGMPFPIFGRQKHVFADASDD